MIAALISVLFAISAISLIPNIVDENNSITVEGSSSVEEYEQSGEVNTISESDAVAKIEETYYQTLKDAFNNVADNETVVLLKDVVDTTGIYVNSVNNVVFDMNGHRLTFGGIAAEGSNPDPNESVVIEIKDSSITVTGGGFVDFNDDYLQYNSIGYIFRASGSSELIIENGTYHAGLTCIQLGDSSISKILGGTFSAYASWGSSYWILNLIDRSNAKFEVYGGEFVNYDPSNSSTENPIANFCATDCWVTEAASGNDTIYTVHELVAMVGDTKFDSIQEAIDEANGSTILLKKDIEESIVIDNETNINLNDFDINNTVIVNTSLILSGNGNINNIVITNKDAKVISDSSKTVETIVGYRISESIVDGRYTYTIVPITYIVTFVYDDVKESIIVSYGNTVSETSIPADLPVTPAGFEYRWMANGTEWDPSAPVRSDVTVVYTLFILNPSVIIETSNGDDGSVTLTAKPSHGAGNPVYTYNWSDSSTGASIIVTQSGTYTVTVTVTAGGLTSGEVSASIDVTVNSDGSSSSVTEGSDGSKTEVTSKPDGTTTTVTQKPDGSETELVVRPDGSQTVTDTVPVEGGTTTTVKDYDQEGNFTGSVATTVTETTSQYGDKVETTVTVTTDSEDVESSETQTTVTSQDGSTVTSATITSDASGTQAVTTTTVEVPETQGESKLTSDAAASAVGQIGTAVGTVTSDSTIIIIVNGESVNVTVESGAANEISGSGATLVFRNEVGELEAPAAVTGNIGKESDFTFRMQSVEDKGEMGEAQQEAVGDRPTYQLTIVSGESEIHELGGEVVVRIPYTLGLGETAETIKVYHVGDDGSRSAMETSYNVEDEVISFVTDHFSYYVIGEPAPEPVPVTFDLSPAGATADIYDSNGVRLYTVHDGDVQYIIPGDYTVVVSAQGYISETAYLSVTGAMTFSETLAPAQVDVTFDLNPANATATVLDSAGNRVGTVTDGRTLILSPGSYTVVVSADGYVSSTMVLTVPIGTAMEFTVVLQETPATEPEGPADTPGQKPDDEYVPPVWNPTIEYTPSVTVTTGEEGVGTTGILACAAAVCAAAIFALFAVFEQRRR